MISEEERKERCKKLTSEISAWISSGPNDTLSRLRKFYNSIISIHLGGEGIMERHYSLMERFSHDEVEGKEVNASFRNYKVNYPGRKRIKKWI